LEVDPVLEAARDGVAVLLLLDGLGRLARARRAGLLDLAALRLVLLLLLLDGGAPGLLVLALVLAEDRGEVAADLDREPRRRVGLLLVEGDERFRRLRVVGRRGEAPGGRAAHGLAR